MDWSSFGSIWNGVTETVSDGMGWLSSTTDEAQTVMGNIQDASQSLKETTLNAYQAANAEKTLSGFNSNGIVKIALFAVGGAALLFFVVKAIK